MLSLSRLLTGSAIYAVGALANRLVGLIMLPVFTAYMSAAEYGVLAMLTALSALLVPLFTLGLGTSIGVSYFNAQEPAQRRSVIWAGGWILLAAACLLALTGWLLREPLGGLAVGRGGYGTHTALGIAAASFGVLATPWQLKLQFEARAAAFVAASLCGVIVTIGLSLWLVVGLRMGALGALAGSLAGQCALASVAFALGAGRPLVQGLGPHVRELLRHGIPMIPSFFLLFVLQYGVRWPLEWYHGLDSVGIYSVGASLGGSLGVFTAAFASAWTPFALGQADRQFAADHAFGRITLYYVAGFGFATSLFFLFAEPLVRLFAHPAFEGGAAAVGFSATGQFFLTLFLLLLPPLYFAKRVQNVVLTQFAAVLVACILALWLVPRHAAAGAAATVALSAFALVVIQWAALRVLPVLQVRYDYARGALLLAIFAGVGWCSFHIRFTEPLAGFVQALGVAVAAAIAAAFIALYLGRTSAWHSRS